MYEKLTKYIRGKKEAVDYYGPSSLFTTIHEFIDNYNLIDLRDYENILAASNIEWSYDSMINANIDELDAVTTIALLVAAVRADHFSEGIWQRFIDEGHIDKWLIHLRSLDT